MKKFKSVFVALIIIIFAIVFIFSAYKIITYFQQSSRSNDIYNNLRDMVSDETTSESTDSDEAAAPVNKKYAEIYALNSDFWGWIKIDGTPIDLPIMHTPSDPEYYLRRAFDKTYLFSGTPFLDARCYDGCGNLIVYAHHMKNKTMFSVLPKYADKQFLEQHKIIKLDTIYNSYKYEVVAAFYSKAYRQTEEGFRYYNYVNLTAPEQFNEFVDGVKKSSLYKKDFSVEYSDELLTLSTCNYHTSNGRFVVVAKRIK